MAAMLRQDRRYGWMKYANCSFCQYRFEIYSYTPGKENKRLILSPSGLRGKRYLRKEAKDALYYLFRNLSSYRAEFDA
jgi:hypothetical protein